MNPLAGTVKVPTPVPIMFVGVVVFVTAVPSAVCENKPILKLAKLKAPAPSVLNTCPSDRDWET